MPTHPLRRAWPLSLLLLLTAFTAPPRKTTVFLVGDSTMAQKTR